MAAAAVVFDLDGTLWDSRPWYASVIAGGDGAATEDVIARLERGAPAAVLLREAGISRRRFRSLCNGPERCEVYPEALETLAHLRDRHIPMGVVTNLPEWMAAPMLDALQLAPLLPAVAHYSTTARRKPYPDPLLAVLNTLGVEPSEHAWYVGDTEADAQASAAAGTSFAWASYGYGDGVVDADVVINKLSDVRSL